MTAPQRSKGSTPGQHNSGTAAISQVEFIALSAMMFATLAFSIDAMLPALPEMARDLSPDAPNRAQLVVTSFVLGMGLGTFITGPLSDSFGRKNVMLGGSILYCISAFVAAQAHSLEVLLAARLFMGLGSSGPRVVAVAVVRDLYAGRQMAQIMSFIMAVFTLVPAVAPLAGATIIRFAGWTGIFYAFILFSFVVTLWMMLRLPETLPLEKRRPFRARALWAAALEMFRHPVSRLSIAIQSLCFATLFSTISVIQPLFDVTYLKADSFPLWFGAIALLAASGSVINAWGTMRFGMRVMVKFMLLTEVVVVLIMLAVWLMADTPQGSFAMFVVWMVSLFFMAGMTIGNLNSIAMEPMGHIAGMAASVIAGVATFIAVLIAVPVGLMFDGTPMSLIFGVLICCAVGLALMQRMPESTE